jgi:hypothetical protein
MCYFTKIDFECSTDLHVFSYSEYENVVFGMPSVCLKGKGLKVLENGVLRRIFRPKMDEVVGGSRKLHNDGLHRLYFSPNIVTRIKSGGSDGQDM